MLLLPTLITFVLGISLLPTSTANPHQSVQKWDRKACALVLCRPAQNGLPGRDGKDGNEGSKGEKGSEGLQGLKGSQGPPGKMGPAGPVGRTGPKGKTGLKGDTGNRGEQGVPGLKGDPGNAGLSGPKGDKGSSGEKGVKGEIGLQGIPGLQGLPGIAGTPGPERDESPVGEKGEKGDKGDRGLQGSSGLQGPQGQIGSPGLTGDKGSVGEKGTKGDSGLSEVRLLKNQVNDLKEELKALQSSFSKYEKVILFPDGRIVGEKIFKTSGYEGNFNSLKQKCSEAGGQLASPQNAAENAAIQEIVVSYKKLVFLGLNDIQTEGQFKYLNGQTIVYSNWQAKEPNGHKGDEDCIEVCSTGKWNDKSCNEIRLIVCEF